MKSGVPRSVVITIIILFSGPFIGTLNSNLLSPGFPTIMSDFSVSTTTVQWLSSIYALVEAVVIPLSAYLVGRFPTRRLFIFGMGSFFAGSATAALAPAFPVLMVGRILQATGTGIMTPLSLTVILLVIPREHRGFIMGLLSLIVGFAPAVGPALAGVIIDGFGWRFVFGLVSALAFVFLMMAIIWLKNHEGFSRSYFDGLSVVLSTLGLLSLLYGLSSFTTTDNPALTGILIVLGIVLLALYVRRQLKLEHPMVKVTILKTRTYAKAIGILMVIQGCLYGIAPVIPVYIQNILGQSASVSGLVLMPGALLGAVFTLVAGGLFDRFGVRKIILPAGAVMAVGGIGLMLLGMDSSIVLVVLALTAFQMGIQGCITPLNTWGINSLPNDVMQHAQSLQNTLIQVATAIGIATLTALSATGGFFAPAATPVEQSMMGVHVTFAATAILVVGAFAIMLFFVKNRPLEKAGLVDNSMEVACVDDKEHDAVPAAQAKPSPESQDRQLSDTPEVQTPLRVGDVMNPHGATVRQGSSMREVVEKMISVETTGVSVVDDDGRLVGFITDGDVARYLARQNAGTTASYYLFFVDDGDMDKRLQDLADTTVDNLATKRVMTVDEDMPLDEACALMTTWNFKKVPVEKDGVLTGSLSRRNIIKYMFETVTP